MMTSTIDIIALAVAAVVSLVALPVVIRLSHRYELLDNPGNHKRHGQPTPFLGGIVLFVAVWLGIAVYLAGGYLNSSDISSLLYIFVGAITIVTAGLVDDFKPLPAWVKLLVQILVGLILFAGGLKVELLTTPYGSVEIGNLSILITVAWVVGLTNAINLIDGLDGLAAGVCLIAALTLLVVGTFRYEGWGAVFLYSMIGFLVIFWYYNRYPARIFLGDSGSMQLGYYFAVFTLLVPLKSFTVSALFVPLLTLGVPIIEALSSAIRRIISGRNIMRADRRHLFHYLSILGLSRGRVVLVFYVLGLIFGFFAIAMLIWNRTLVLGLLVLFMVVIFVVYFILITGLSRRLRNGAGEYRHRSNKNR